MADYTTVTMNGNSGTDAASVYTTTIQFGGTLGANEWRWATTGLGGAGIASAAWPNVIKPGATQPVGELWACTGDAVCVKMNYAGDNTHPQMGRFSFDALGSPASAMQLSAFQDISDTTPVPGVQVANSSNGQNIINGQTADSNNTSYLKGQVFGCGFPAAGAQETPAAVTGAFGGTLTVTSGSAGALVAAAAAWLTNWQSFQGWLQYAQGTATPKVLQAFFWYWALAMFVGPSMQTGNMIFCPLTLQYTWT
jgi:hypothetical protein